MNAYFRNIKKDCANVAPLKDLTTRPPMTAEAHKALMLKRRMLREKVKDARDMKFEAGRDAW